MVRFDVRKIAILLLPLLAAPAAHAQLWSGPAAVEIQVEDQKGAPVPEAALKLVFKGVDPKDGPAPLATDAKGRANVSGLAEGPWQLEVSREGFMTYIAEVNVRTKGRPTLEEALVLAGSGALRSMKVRITRGRPAAAPPQAVAEKPAPAPRPASPKPTAARPAEPRPQIQPAPAEPAPAPKPASVPQEMPKEAPPAKPAPQPAPEPAQPKTQPAPAPAPAPVTPPAPAPPPARLPTVTPSTETTPPTIPPMHPQQPVRMRSSKDRTCPDCQPGESALSTEVLVTSSGEGCGNVLSSLKGGVPGELPSGCHVLQLTLPAGAKYSGYRYEIQDGRDSFDCPAGKDCPGSSGRWPVDPIVTRNPEGTRVLAPFESGAGDRERRAVLTVYFKEK